MHSPPIRILGIDPGSRLTGYGLLELRAGKSVCIAGGTLRLKQASYLERIGQLFHELRDIMQEFQPDEVAIEQVFVHKNVASALKLGQARGAILAAVVQSQVPVFEYAPRMVKQAVVGRGGASKAQIQHMVHALLNLSKKPQEDAADALAVALCHTYRRARGPGVV